MRKLGVVLVLLTAFGHAATPTLIQWVGGPQTSSNQVKGNLVLSSVANASAGSTVYTGTITGGGSNALANIWFVVSGFTTAANNGLYFSTASSTTTLTLLNAGGVSETHAANAGGAYVLQLPNKAQSGNALILSCYSDSGTGTITIGDDSNANTWTAGPTNTGVHTKKLSQWYAPNVSSSTRIIAASPATSTANWLCAAYEFNNISTSSPGDGNSGNHGTSATYTAGSFTPTTANDLIQTNCFEEGVFGSNNNTTSWTSGGTQGTVTWSLNGADIWQVMGAQWGQQGTAAAINPQMTASLSSDFICVAQALKTATAGGTASGLRVVGMQHTDSANFTACTLNSSCTVTIQMPTSGNALPIAYEGTTAMSLSAVSSTPSNTWVLPAGCLVQISNGAQWVYAVNASTSNTQTFSITQAFYGGAETIIIFDIAGAATSAFDQCITDHATPANHNDITPASLTPAIAGEWMGAVIGVQGGTVVSLTSPAANQNFLSTTFRGEFGLNVPTDRNNGFGGYLIPGTSATSFTWHAGDTTNWAGWASSQIAIKPPSGTTTPQMLDLGVGQ